MPPITISWRGVDTLALVYPREVEAEKETEKDDPALKQRVEERLKEHIQGARAEFYAKKYGAGAHSIGGEGREIWGEEGE